ncbi:hypothetical protein KC219_24350, partial [Mycobacterium tuberculosis]|nr:hypothetical protein [Mycobacterium tuberculosis]
YCLITCTQGRIQPSPEKKFCATPTRPAAALFFFEAPVNTDGQGHTSLNLICQSSGDDCVAVAAASAHIIMRENNVRLYNTGVAVLF